MDNNAEQAVQESTGTRCRGYQATAEQVVKRHSLAAAGLGLVPVPFLDMALVAGAQLNMLRRLAKLYGIPFSEQLGKAAVATLVGGSLPVTSWHLLKFVPGFGSWLGAVSVTAVAGAATYGIGKVFIQHFESGGTFLDFDPDKVRDYYNQQRAKSREVLAQDPSATEPAQAPGNQKVAEKAVGKVAEKVAEKAVEKAAEKAVGKVAEKAVEKAAAAAPEQAVSEPPPAELPVLPEHSKVIISSLRFLGRTKGSQSDEFVELKNTGGSPQDISGWRLRSEGGPGQVFVFPAGTVIEPGVNLRVYTALESPRPNCFSFDSKRALWNDHGDLACLLDAAGRTVAKHGYGSRETRTIESITAAFGVPELQVVYNQEQLATQKIYRGKMDFLTALEEALRCLISEPNGGVNPIAATVVRDTGAPADRSAPAVQELIRVNLNAQKLILLHNQALPDGITSVREHWIFRLDPGLGDRHYIISSRSGTQASYQKLS